jgi:predicted ABC-type sugar transport system permease subunit
VFVNKLLLPTKNLAPAAPKRAPPVPATLLVSMLRSMIDTVLLSAQTPPPAAATLLSTMLLRSVAWALAASNAPPAVAALALISHLLTVTRVYLLA